MNSGDRDSTLEGPAANAPRNGLQQVPSIKHREIHIVSPSVGSPPEVLDGSGEGGLGSLPRAAGPMGSRMPARGDAPPPRNGGTPPQFADRVLTCVGCNAEFVFSAGEQAFFYEREFKNDPRHCKPCNARHNPLRRRPRVEARVTCAGCGSETTVPFVPKNGKPVLCSVCFRKAKLPPADTWQAL